MSKNWFVWYDEELDQYCAVNEETGRTKGLWATEKQAEQWILNQGYNLV